MHKSFQHSGYNISYQLFGSGKPIIIFVHGFPEDGTVFENQYNFLKEKYTVIVPDLPGSGKSGQNLSLHYIEEFAEIPELILQNENIEKCFLFGHSMGGYIALAFAEKYPERLLGLGLIHSTAYADSQEKKENRQRAIELMEKYGGYSFLKNSVPNLFTKKYVDEHFDVVSALIEKGKNFDTKTLQQYYQMMKERPDRTEILKKINVPVLFIIGEKDTSVLLHDILPQTHLPNISFIKILPNAAHMGILENVNEVNITIESMIKTI